VRYIHSPTELSWLRVYKFESRCLMHHWWSTTTHLVESVRFTFFSTGFINFPFPLIFIDSSLICKIVDIRLVSLEWTEQLKAKQSSFSYRPFRALW